MVAHRARVVAHRARVVAHRARVVARRRQQLAHAFDLVRQRERAQIRAVALRHHLVQQRAERKTRARIRADPQDRSPARRRRQASGARNFRGERRLADAALADQRDERVIAREQRADVHDEIAPGLVVPRDKADCRRGGDFGLAAQRQVGVVAGIAARHRLFAQKREQAAKRRVEFRFVAEINPVDRFEKRRHFAIAQQQRHDALGAICRRNERGKRAVKLRPLGREIFGRHDQRDLAARR